MQPLPAKLAQEELLQATKDTALAVAAAPAEHEHVKDATGLQFRDAVATSDLATSAQLLAATKKGDVLAMHQLISVLGPASVNQTAMWGSTPLIIAAQYGQADAALALLEYAEHIDVVCVNERGASAILYACLESHSEADACKVMRRIIEVCPKIATSESFCTPAELHNCACDIKGYWTPLSAVCANGHCDAWDVLNQANPTGCSVHSAIRYTEGSLHKGKVIGCTVPFGPRKVAVVQQATPLMIAAAYGRTELIEKLLANATATAATGTDSTASLSPFSSLFAARDGDGASVFHHAARGLLPESVLTSLVFHSTQVHQQQQQAGNDVCFPLLPGALSLDSSGFSVLHYLCHNGKMNMKAIKLYLNAIVVAKKSPAASPGACAGTGTVVQWVNAVSVKEAARGGAMASYAVGSTALHIAVSKKVIDLCAELLLAGADPNIEDAQGESPLSLAKKQSNLGSRAGTGGAKEAPLVVLLSNAKWNKSAGGGSVKVGNSNTNSSGRGRSGGGGMGDMMVDAGSYMTPQKGEKDALTGACPVPVRGPKGIDVVRAFAATSAAETAETATYVEENEEEEGMQLEDLEEWLQKNSKKSQGQGQEKANATRPAESAA